MADSEHVRVVVEATTFVADARVTVNGRAMSLSAWIASVEQRLVVLGVSLEKLDELKLP